MSEILEIFVKVALPIILALVAIFSACKDLFLTKKRIFEEREKLSKLSYDLYKITEDEDLKRLAVEYGYAAITKENFLNLAQRKALVRSENPTRDIDLFVKCRGLLDIKTEPLSFFWKKKRHSNIISLAFIISLKMFLYVFGAIIFLMPLFYSVFLPDYFVEKMSHLAPLAKIGITLYALFAGAFLAYVNLSAAVRLIDSYRLIKRHQVE
ncbi:hypothetical protein C3408_13935 [Candidatus Pantoea alvi]|uniref:hypothetical protein n=1 Tax=Enterobacter agglomerans TaxID=549 RepID=UPI000CDDD9AD|nr:hypothetical protein [Pantoea agglomerans]POW56543.1 hypothetical protein C3408_13935 [Pantoea alvi]UBN55969.1 hypothetical protein LB453_10660 [Pantoea agglomerans]